MKPIDGYTTYFATEDGRIWATPSNRLPNGGYLKSWNNGKKPYQVVMLYKDGVSKNILVHRIIAKSFIPNPNNLPEVNHINGKADDNRVENLEWVTSKQNKQHAIKMGLYKNLGSKTPKGSKHPRAKLTESDVLRARSMREHGYSSRDIAKALGVSYHLIDLICARKVWKHI